jgi:hypothetical protein
MAIVATAYAAASVPAQPPLAVGASGKPVRGEVHRWLRQSRMPFARGPIQIVRARCPGEPGFSGCVYSTHSLRVYLRPNLRNARSVLYHELGHVYDLRILHARERQAFRRIMGIAGKEWFHARVPPAELFADGYGICALHGERWSAKLSTAYHYRPTRAQHRAVCRLIRRAGAPGGLPPSPPPGSPNVIGPSPSKPPHRE